MNGIERQMHRYNAQRQAGESLMTKKRLAAEAGVSIVTLWRHMTYVTGMSPEQAAAYARVLRCSIEDLLDGEAAT